jgi:uncharacterized protein (DUF885 family)
MTNPTEAAFALAMIGIDKVWAEIAKTPFVQRDLAGPIDRLPDIGEAAVIARSARAKEALAVLDKVDASSLPREIALTVSVARAAATRMASEAERYWLAIDVGGVGFFALFAPTAYSAGFLFSSVGGMFAKHRFDSRGDLDRYLGLLEDYGRMLDQMRERTEGQAARGMRIPRPQLDQSIELMQRMARGAGALVPPAERLAAMDPGAADAIAARVDRSVKPAFARLVAMLEAPDYRSKAPDSVGMAQYEGGAALYAELVREHSTLDLTPSEIHAEGLRRVEATRAAMQALLDDQGFSGSLHDYHAALEKDQRWRASSAEEIGAFFDRYLARIGPDLERVFRFRPDAPFAAVPLPEALSASMTFGFYDAPGPQQPAGRYLFNAANLANGTLANIPALAYHELVPGHHFHMASQRENEKLHPVRAMAFYNAFNEGWAEYAATLAGELGMYAEPEVRFGRLMMDAFLNCRLVVDTGMNALGWTLEQARDYMRENAFFPETEIRSETLRYSCDLPGQAVAYKLGEHFLVAQREMMRARLGERFDLRDFHDAVLKPGALPLPLVAENVAAAAREIELAK